MKFYVTKEIKTTEHFVDFQHSKVTVRFRSSVLNGTLSLELLNCSLKSFDKASWLARQTHGPA